MEIPPTPGNKRFPCPACHRPVQVSIRIGYQDYTCSRNNRNISVQEQKEVFKEHGTTIAIDSYDKVVKGLQSVIVIGRFPILSEWAFQVAVRQGYPEMEAYSLALSRARASSANPAIKTTPNYTYDGERVTPKEIPRSTIVVESKKFMGIETPITIRPDGQIRGVYMKNDIPQLCKPDMYEQIVIKKIKHDAYKVIHRSLRELANIFSGKDLEEYGTFLWNLFAPVTKEGSKPPPGEPGYFRVSVINNLTEDFTVSRYSSLQRKVAA
jgi:hypothetical protein